MTEERILDFLDGNLGASEEEELLHRLAVSPERRNLLKQHLQMRDLTSTLARRQYVSVPKVLTASLFTALAANGYAGPALPSPSSKESLVASLENNIGRSAESIVATKSTPFYKKSSILILASLVSFISGAALIFAIMPEARQDKFVSSVSVLLKGSQGRSIASSATLQSSKGELMNMESPIPIETSMSTLPTKKYIEGHSRSVILSNYNTEANSNQILIGNTNTSPVSQLATKDLNLLLISKVGTKFPPITGTSDIGGSIASSKNPFEPIQVNSSERSFIDRISFSFRSGEGKAPGNQSALTGSMLELKASYDINDWLVTKFSIGDFMPYETQAVAADPGFNSDGIRLLQLKPTLQYRTVVGAEMGIRFNLLDAPFEFDGGFISDLSGNIIPRLGFFTSLMLQDNWSMNLGLEGMIYSHDISSSLRNAQNAYAGEHPALIGSLQSKESTGFVGPSIELVWHF